jgi:hypothetical protein
VPVPEVFGLTEDEEQRFIYMSLIEGDTLQDRWCDLSEDERRAICKEFRHMVKVWRALEQALTSVSESPSGATSKQA